MQTSEHDLKMYRAFKGVVQKSKFEIQGSAVTTVGSLFTWFYELEERMQEPKEVILPKEKKQAIKKNGI